MGDLLAGSGGPTVARATMERAHGVSEGGWWTRRPLRSHTTLEGPTTPDLWAKEDNEHDATYAGHRLAGGL